MKIHPYLLYIIYAIGPDGSIRSYVGITNNLPGRLRKHRGEIKGGAKFTTRYTKIGWKWKLGATVHGFTGHQESLQFEWAVQHPKKSKHLKTEQKAYSDNFVRNVSNAFCLMNKGNYQGHTWACVHGSPEKSNIYIESFGFKRAAFDLLLTYEYAKFVERYCPFDKPSTIVKTTPPKQSGLAERYRRDIIALREAARKRNFQISLMSKPKK